MCFFAQPDSPPLTRSPADNSQRCCPQAFSCLSFHCINGLHEGFILKRMQQEQTLSNRAAIQHRQLGLWRPAGIPKSVWQHRGDRCEGNSTSLSDAYDQMQKGMKRKHAKEIAGRTPKTSAPTRPRHDDGATNLSSEFTPDSSKTENQKKTNSLLMSQTGTRHPARVNIRSTHQRSKTPSI